MPIVADQVGGEIGAALKAFAADPADARAIAAIRADPVYVGQIGTTCVPTLVTGGNAQNALPPRATANITCRIFPGRGLAAVRAAPTQITADPPASGRTSGDGTCRESRFPVV